MGVIASTAFRQPSEIRRVVVAGFLSLHDEEVGSPNGGAHKKPKQQQHNGRDQQVRERGYKTNRIVELLASIWQGTTHPLLSLLCLSIIGSVLVLPRITSAAFFLLKSNQER